MDDIRSHCNITQRSEGGAKCQMLGGKAAVVLCGSVSPPGPAVRPFVTGGRSWPQGKPSLPSSLDTVFLFFSFITEEIGNGSHFLIKLILDIG